MHSLYDPPNSALKIEEPRRFSVAQIFLAANSGLLTTPVFIFLMFYLTDSMHFYTIYVAAYSACCSLPVSIVITLFRKIHWVFAAVAGSILSLLLYFALPFFGLL